MIYLTFKVPSAESPWRKTWDSVNQVDPGELNEIDIRYKYFGANVHLLIDDVEVVSKKRFVTLVDFALSISHAVKRLSSGEDAAIGFTESEEVIRLHSDDSLVAISSSKHSWEVSVDREEFIVVLTDFLRQVHSRLMAEFPWLAADPVIQRFSVR
ncbi:hypothetical protein ACGF0J_10905 [Nonomuraea sp. NPDC047897]|uniref:hypothetical protein n=1 Tax=Nonomuraea sp. NPDC047897 TaxID=3364346 RepID=UPI0037101A82